MIPLMIGAIAYIVLLKRNNDAPEPLLLPGPLSLLLFLLPLFLSPHCTFYLFIRSLFTMRGSLVLFLMFLLLWWLLWWCCCCDGGGVVVVVVVMVMVVLYL